ncbi:MAG TPA: acetate--CoA ligase family protein [Kiloniellales bacterium]|nr:acetate--CoA ligase family protein [Kiloniellales bacterium]
MSATATLKALFEPRRVAVVGASDDPTRIGGRPIAYMKAAGFQGELIPVNAKRSVVQGLPAVPSVAAIEGKLDFGLIALPAPQVLDALRDCRAKGAGACLVFSSGFAEAGAEGAAMQRELRRTIDGSGMRIVGPNCLGAFNAHNGFIPCFSSTLDRGAPLRGGLSIASQSGAYGSHIYIVARGRGVGIAKFATTGNEVDIDVAEMIALLVEDDATHVIAAYVEGVRDGNRLRAALELARQNRKPVIFMKVGRSAVGAEAAASHTAALAGENRVYDAVLRECGAWRVKTTEEMVDIAYAARRRVYPAGRRLGIVTISGGAGVLMADAAQDLSLEVPALPPAVQAELKAILPFAAVRNPVDVTAQVFNDIGVLEANIRILLQQGGFDALLCFWTSVAGYPSITEPLLKAFRRGVANQGERLIVQSIVALPEVVASHEADGYPVFEDPTRAVVAIAALLHFGRSFARPPAPPIPLQRRPLPAGPLDEVAAKRLLAAAGVPVPEERLATAPEQAAEAAKAIDGPVALKLVSADIAHKTEIGGVLLDVAPEQAAAGCVTLLERARRHAPGARVEGLLVTPMLKGGVECILGAKVDPVFGPVVLFGLGGIFAEALEDVVCASAPLDEAQALALLDEIKGRRVLDGLRGKPPVDKAALARAIAALSRFAAAHAHEIASVDINPLLALPDRAVALDALIVRRR